MTIQSNTKDAQKLQLRIMQLLSTRNIDQTNCRHIRLALEEALMNAIKHGNRHDPTKEIRIDYQLTIDGLFIASIEDEGDGFDFSSLPDPTLPENLEKPNGRGVFLLNNFMDTVTYNPTGNKVTFSKQLASTAQNREAATH